MKKFEAKPGDLHWREEAAILDAEYERRVKKKKARKMSVPKKKRGAAQ